MSAPVAVRQDSRVAVESLLVGLAVVFVAARLKLVPGQLVTAGDVLALLLLPVWVPTLRRHVGAQALMLTGLAAVVSGLVLTYLSLPDHTFDVRVLLANNALLVGLLVSAGFLLWAAERLGPGAVVALFGVGQLLGVDRGSEAYAQEPWKFGYATGVTLVVLGLAYRRRGWQLVLLAALVLLASLSDSRSGFAILLLTAALVLWQVRPLRRGSVRASAVRGALGLGIFAAVIYQVGTALIVRGVLGATTQRRSLRQIDESGSLLLGGRPEIAATVALLRDHVWGFGSGVLVNHHDLTVAKAGMWAINYDPDNGYVEKYMFGASYEVHSVLGDGWARFGLVGLGLFVLWMVLVVRWLGFTLSATTASAAPLLLAITTLWDLLFAPLYAAGPVLMLTFAVILQRRSATPEDDPGPLPSPR